MVVMLVIVIIYYVMGGQKLSTGYPQVWIKVLIKLSTGGGGVDKMGTSYTQVIHN
jgi:hypothetical protein